MTSFIVLAPPPSISSHQIRKISGNLTTDDRGQRRIYPKIRFDSLEDTTSVVGGNSAGRSVDSLALTVSPPAKKRRLSPTRHLATEVSHISDAPQVVNAGRVSGSVDCKQQSLSPSHNNSTRDGKLREYNGQSARFHTRSSMAVMGSDHGRTEDVEVSDSGPSVSEITYGGALADEPTEVTGIEYSLRTELTTAIIPTPASNPAENDTLSSTSVLGNSPLAASSSVAGPSYFMTQNEHLDESSMESGMALTQTQGGNASISALPDFSHIQMDKIRPLAELSILKNASAAGRPPRVSIMVAVIEIGEVRYVKPNGGVTGNAINQHNTRNSSRRGGRHHVGALDEERTLVVGDIKVIQPTSMLLGSKSEVKIMTITMWGEEVVKAFLEGTDRVKKGDVVYFENLVHKRSNRPNDDHMTLTASSSVSGLKPKHTILYRSFPHRYLHQPVCGGGFTQGISGQGHWTISDDDKQFRPDARMRKMDSMLRRMFDLAEWVYVNAHLFGQPMQERSFGT